MYANNPLVKPRWKPLGFPRVAYDYRDLPEVGPSQRLLVGADNSNYSGDIAHSTLFACGNLEGRVHICNLRNVKQPAIQVSPHPPTIAAGFFTYRTDRVPPDQDQQRNLARISHILAASYDNRIATIPYTYTNSVIQST